MKKILFLCFLLVVTNLKAQTNTDYLKEINRDIWQPFIEAYATLDVDKYKTLQSADFIRANGSAKQLSSFEDYFNATGTWFNDLKKEGRKMDISFRFTERFANGVAASERGIYQLKSFDTAGKELWKGYGKFHVFMRKINEKWKFKLMEKDKIPESRHARSFPRKRG